MSRNYAPMLNCTGRELPVDMTCPNTVECFKFDANAESFFFDENNTLPLVERVKAIFEFAAKHAPGHNLIVENNELGRALIDSIAGDAPTMFVISHKQPNGLHWYYGFTSRLIDPASASPRVGPSDEWLKTAIEGHVQQADSDFMNIWAPGSDQSIIQANPGVNVGALPTDDDLANLEKLLDPATFEGYSKKVEGGETLTLEESMRAVAELGKLQLAIQTATAPLLAKINLLEKTVSHYRRGYGDPATELFEAIKHGDEKHQAWLKAALTAYYNGQPIPREDGSVGLHAAAIINPHPRAFNGSSVADTGLEDVSGVAKPAEDVIGQRVPASVHFVNGEQGHDQ